MTTTAAAVVAVFRPGIWGETVTVRRRVADGVDELGAPTYTWTETPVDDVIVTPGPRNDLDAGNRPDGVTVVWNCLFPKTFTGSLRGARLVIQGEEYAVIGDPKPYPAVNTPTRWHMPVEVGRTDG